MDNNTFQSQNDTSLLQKAMVKIFQPLLKTTLIYIDDILMFSDIMDIYELLLQRFIDIVTKYGIMLFQKKVIVVTSEFDFGMHIKMENILYSRILLKTSQVSDYNLTKQQAQQFLGVVNYMTYFLK